MSAMILVSRGEGFPCHFTIQNWNPVCLSASKEDMDTKETEAVFRLVVR